jgi:purine-cytosine permease-like protein
MRTGRIEQKKWNLNRYIGLLGALVYMVARFGFSLTALSSVFLGIIAIAMGILLVHLLRKKTKSPDPRPGA